MSGAKLPEGSFRRLELPGGGYMTRAHYEQLTFTPITCNGSSEFRYPIVSLGWVPEIDHRTPATADDPWVCVVLFGGGVHRLRKTDVVCVTDDEEDELPEAAARERAERIAASRAWRTLQRGAQIFLD